LIRFFPLLISTHIDSFTK